VNAQQGLEAGHTNASTKPLLEFLPKSPEGSIIITSRSQEVAFKFVDRQDIIRVQPMNELEALKLLQRKLGLKVETPDMQKLVEELEFMPLAIIQAAGYIVHREPRCSVSQYLEMFKNDREATKLLDYEAGHLYRDWEAKNSILVTWQISFDYIRRIRPSAADLLSVMSFFDRQGVAENLLRVPHIINDDDLRSEETVPENSDRDTDSTLEFDTDHGFEDDITTLRDFSFIFLREDSTAFAMHRLVQLTVRVWLKANGQMEQWMERFIAIMCQMFPTGDYENWAQCRSLFPHVKSAVFHRPESHKSIRQWATLLYNGAWYAQTSGNYVESRCMAFLSRKNRLEILGAEDEETLSSTAMLAIAYRLEGRWEEAEQLDVQVMETSKTKLGADHPDTLTSMANLASTYRKQGRWEEAEQLEVQVMETSKTKLGADHPDTLTSMTNLASTYRKQGRWKEAEQLEVQVMETRKTKFGVDHPDTLMSMANLAATFWNQGRWQEAEQLEVQVMETRKTKLGVDHPNTLTSMANLASTFWNQGRWQEAEQLGVQVMEMSKTKLGADHPDTLTSMANLASTFWTQGRWKEAEQLEVQVMETSKTKLGADHPSTLTSMANLAHTFRSSGQDTAAVLLMAECVRLRDQKLGPDHPHTMYSRSTLSEWRRKASCPSS
jgi:tetratricopeptide (TPR) repeat protein